LPAGLSLPPHIYLINLRNHTAHDTRVEWYRESQAGLQFIRAFDINTLDDTGLSYLRRLWNAYRCA